MTRMAELRARRQALLMRCSEQRLELAQRIAGLRPYETRAPGLTIVGARYAARHPLAWIAVLGALMLMKRTRDVLSLLVFMRSALPIITRAVQLLRLVGHARAPRAGGTQDP
jgi:uncharacterized membrane protein